MSLKILSYDELRVLSRTKFSAQHSNPPQNTRKYYFVSQAKFEIKFENSACDTFEFKVKSIKFTPLKFKLAARQRQIKFKPARRHHKYNA